MDEAWHAVGAQSGGQRAMEGNGAGCSKEGLS